METENLLKSEKIRAKGVSALLKLAASRNDSASKFESKAILSEIFREDGDARKSFEIVSDCVEYDKISSTSTFKFKSAYLMAFLEAAHCNAVAREKPELREAFKMLDYAERSTSGIDKARSQYKYGAVLYGIGEYEKAESCLKKAIATSDEYMRSRKNCVSEGDVKRAEENADCRKLRARIDELLFLISIALLEKEYGEPYALYVKARTLFYGRSYEPAMVVCRDLMVKHPGTIYEQSIRITYADCLEETGNSKEARKELEHFIKTNPNGPFCGEAMMRLGKHLLEKDLDVDGSMKWYIQALSSFRMARERNDVVDLYTVPDKVALVSAPKGPFSTVNGWGRVICRKDDPKELLSSRMPSAPWYVDDMEKNCWVYIGFLRFMKGDFIQAKEAFSHIGSLDRDILALDNKRVPNVLMRLRNACDQGYLQTTRQHMMKLQPENRIRLGIADLYWTTEKYPEAISICEVIAKDAKAGAEDKAYALAVKARALCSMGDIRSAEKVYQSIYDGYRKTFSAPYALMQLGFISNSRGGLKAIEFYEKCRKEYPGTPFAECSLARCVYTADGLDAGLAWKYAEQYLKEYPEGKYSGAVKETVSGNEYGKFRG